MMWKKGKSWGGSEKHWALELRWRRVADYSRGGFQPPETHDRRQWTAVYVGSLAARKMMTGDDDGWNRRCSGCNRRDTVEPDRVDNSNKTHSDTDNWSVDDTDYNYDNN